MLMNYGEYQGVDGGRVVTIRQGQVQMDMGLPERGRLEAAKMIVEGEGQAVFTV